MNANDLWGVDLKSNYLTVTDNPHTDMDYFVADRIHRLASNFVERDDYVFNGGGITRSCLLS